MPEGVISKTVSSLHRLNVGNLTFDDDGLDGITQLDFQNFRGLDASRNAITGKNPSAVPSLKPSTAPSNEPSLKPSTAPSFEPTTSPTQLPSMQPAIIS